ncbi:Glycosyltransferase involved in cell wall bisynthesis [Geodermatophilus dictyosporus]|uniref:Glycosyltransferase involved in cell wall bisynthesis n=1 Tax=Geodermatophilus dictyosporus TaxID=1523247 RepID=A0A1I5JWM1_9ACTN|nr:glycosyltransferase [Geodermatophilus dictyosporus]SFO77139.1 Glycosyltransferase involved in cell wall bisynthesis [Geodermatophilus dictyosporus]
MHVLHAIGEMGTGGAESLVVELVRRGPQVGWRSSVASAGGSREDEIVAAGLADVHRVPLSRRSAGGLARAVAATRRALAATDPDAVIAHNVGVTAAVALAQLTRRRRVPVVTVFHGVAAEDYRPAARLLGVAPRAVVTVSEAIAGRLRAAGLRRRPVVIPNAVTAPDLPDPADARRELGLAPDAPVALCAARLVDQKRHDVLLRAWARVPGDCVLLVAGDGPNRPAIEALHADLGLGDRVRLLGNRSDVPRLLAAADVATLASDWEGLPVFVLEAMAAGRPVVATAVDGLTEVLRDGGGLLVPPGAPEDLAAALGRVLTDHDARTAASEAARRTIAERYDPVQMTRRYDALLRALLGDRAGSTAHGAAR